MARVIVTLQLMPTSPDVDLKKVRASADRLIAAFAGEPSAKAEEKPIAFGLKALLLTFIADESKGGTDQLEADLGKVQGVESVQVTDVRRAVG